jgi:hypothetical protein
MYQILYLDCGIASVLTVAIEADVHYNGIMPYHLVIQAYEDKTFNNL